MLDNFSRRAWDDELGAALLAPIRLLHQRLALWRELSGLRIDRFAGDMCDYAFLEPVVRDFQPDVVVHPKMI